MHVFFVVHNKIQNAAHHVDDRSVSQVIICNMPFCTFLYQMVCGCIQFKVNDLVPHRFFSKVLHKIKKKNWAIIKIDSFWLKFLG